MSGWVAVALGLALLISGVRAETLTVATYNIENDGTSNRMTEAGYRKDYPKPEPEKRALRAVFKAMNADVVVLQEMGSRPYLDELPRDLKNEGLDYPHVALATAADADRPIAIMSRRALLKVTTHADLEFTYFGAKEPVKRGLLEATVVTSAGELTIFAVHLKSRFTERPDDGQSTMRRTGEAAAIRDRILKRFPLPAAASFVILGDCNDGKSSKALERLRTRGKTVVAELLPAADSRGESWTHAFRKDDTYTQVDHILVSPGLSAAVRGGTARIVDAEGVRAASDHRPVVATLEFAGKK